MGFQSPCVSSRPEKVHVVPSPLEGAVALIIGAAEYIDPQMLPE